LEGDGNKTWQLLAQVAREGQAITFRVSIEIAYLKLTGGRSNKNLCYGGGSCREGNRRTPPTFKKAQPFPPTRMQPGEKETVPDRKSPESSKLSRSLSKRAASSAACRNRWNEPRVNLAANQNPPAEPRKSAILVFPRKSAAAPPHSDGNQEYTTMNNRAARAEKKRNICG
jgi:hypothetical protein